MSGPFAAFLGETLAVLAEESEQIAAALFAGFVSKKTGISITVPIALQPGAPPPPPIA